MATIDLSTPEGKYKLANNTTFHRVFELALNAVVKELINDVQDAAYFNGKVANEKMRAKALALAPNSIPSIDYKGAMFLLSDLSSNVDDTQLTSTAVFNAIKVQAKSYFKYLAKVTPEDETTII